MKTIAQEKIKDLEFERTGGNVWETKSEDEE
jgi:hypothetical protein